MTSNDLVRPAQTLDVNTARYTDLLEAQSFFAVESLGLIDTDVLDGVPFIITGITFQRIVIAKDPSKQQRGYVSVEATIADERTLARCIGRGQIKTATEVAGLLFDPNERVIFNDGGTGIRRQLCMLLDRAELIRVGGDETDERRFDVPWTEFENVGEQWKASGTDDNDEPVMLPYITSDKFGSPLLIRVPRGTHSSKYNNEFGEGTTWYLG